MSTVSKEYTHIHAHAHTHTHTPVQSLECYLCSCFRTDCLALDSLFLCSSLGKTTSAASSFPYLPLFLCVLMRSSIFLISD